MIKENLKIRVLSNAERREVQELLFSLGFGWDLFGQRTTIREFNDENIHVYIDNKIIRHCSDNKYSESLSNKSITIEELRELARPKEYLDENYQLQVTNQPKEGWLLVKPEYQLFVTDKLGIGYFTTIRTLHKDSKILWQRNPKETAMNTEKKGRFLHQEWYEAFGRGEDVQFHHDTDSQWRDLKLNFHTLNLFNVEGHKFRLKPQTITIGSRTINKPISVKPKVGVDIFVPSYSESGYFSFVWTDYESNIWYFENNLCYLTPQDAIAMSEALLELLNPTNKDYL